MKSMTNESRSGEETRPSLRLLARDVWRDFRGAFRPLVVYEAVFKGAVILLGAAGAGWIVGPLIASTGHAAVTNTEIARFLLSPAGIAYLVLIALSLMLATLLEHVGVIAIAAANREGRAATVRDTLAALATVSLRLFSVRHPESLDARVPLRPVRGGRRTGVSGPHVAA